MEKRFYFCAEGKKPFIVQKGQEMPLAGRSNRVRKRETKTREKGMLVHENSMLRRPSSF